MYSTFRAASFLGGLPNKGKCMVHVFRTRKYGKTFLVVDNMVCGIANFLFSCMVQLKSLSLEVLALRVFLPFSRHVTMRKSTLQ
jgi:hypothetical protein